MSAPLETAEGVNDIYAEWLECKRLEKLYQDSRRALEDEMVKAFAIPDDLDGVKSIDADGYNVKIVGRMNRKVDSDKVQELAAEHGLTDHLPNLFRWKPEINMAVWKATSEEITRPLLGAITAKPGRPSINITKE